MRIPSDENFWSGAMFMAFGLGFAIAAQKYDMGTLRSLGPAWFPTAVGGLTAAIGAILAIKALRSNDGAHIEPFGWRGIFGIFGSLILFAMLLPTFGLMVSLAALIMGSSMATLDFRWRESVIVTAALLMMGYLVFVAALKIQVQVWPVFLGE